MHSNGFTMLEMLVVLLIVSILSISMPSKANQDSLAFFMKNIESLSIYTQEKAFLSKDKKYIQFQERAIQFDEIEYDIPNGISCDACTLYFNEKGNINHARTIRCHNGDTVYKLIFQLGSGRVRYEKE